MVRSAKLLLDEKLASVVMRLMIAMNDLGMTNSSMAEWQATDDPKKRARWRGGLLYFGRVQSAHLFEALSIIQEIGDDPDLMRTVNSCDTKTIDSFDTAAKSLESSDFALLARLRNNTAFHYNVELPLRRLKRLVERWPNHVTPFSLGSDTLDWHFELGDLIIDEIVIREIFAIPEAEDVRKGAVAVLDRLHKIGTAFSDFAGYFIHECTK
jgi:hypothetical protein